MTDSCIFCKIHSGKIHSKKIIESEKAFVIADITPQAPHHYLVIPKTHVASLNDLDTKTRHELLPELFTLADEIAQAHGFKNRGYRTVINNQEESGQTVPHLHLHVLGGAKLKGGFGA